MEVFQNREKTGGGAGVALDAGAMKNIFQRVAQTALVGMTETIYAVRRNIQFRVLRSEVE